MTLSIRPHSLQPQRDTARVAFCYCAYHFVKGSSHTGLGCVVNITANVLWRHGIQTDVLPLSSAAELETQLAAIQSQALTQHQTPVSHVVIAAPWFPIDDLNLLVHQHRGVHFAVICHSDVGFLQADPQAVQRLKEMAALELVAHNFSLAGNNARFVQWMRAAISPTCVLLPNLYDCTSFAPPHRLPVTHRPIRIGCYGAMRPLKNMITAAAAALEISRTLRTDVEFHISGTYDEGQNSLAPIKEMLAGQGTSLVIDPWRSWADFRHLIRSMDVLMQPSFTESFNLVTADGIAEGVPSAVSETIDWVPPGWIAHAHDTHSLAKTAMALLHDPHAAHEGQEALRRYVKHGMHEWLEYLISGQVG